MDDETMLDFDRNPAVRCRELAAAIRAPGGYTFSNLRAHLIPKANGKDRVICVPTIRDRVVQRAIVNHLSAGDRCGLLNSISYGFIPGRSVEQATKRARSLRLSQGWVYKTDITSFFDSVSRDILGAKTHQFVRDRSLHRTLECAAACEIEETSKKRATRIKEAGIHVGRGIRQGMPLSPFFANLLLRDFDRDLEKQKIAAVRYADDLICFASSQEACESIHKVVCARLSDLGLVVPEPGPTSKTMFFEPDATAEFLGLTFRKDGPGYVLDVSAEQIQKVRQRIVDFADIDVLTRSGIALAGFFRRLDGLISGYLGAYEFADNASHVQKALASARLDAVKRILFEGLGIQLGTLNHAQRQFIGLGEELNA